MTSPAALLVVLVAIASGCSGDGPSGLGPDRTPPAAPQLGLLDAGIPSDGESTVRGAPGAVEPRSTAVIENLTAATREGGPVVVETRAGVDGAFAVRIRAALGDELEVLARDDAGNAGPAVTIPAGPNRSTFQLSPVSGSEQFGVAGRPLPEPFRVRVRGGNPPVDLAGVEVTFEVVSGGGTLDPLSMRTDSVGVAEAVLTLGGAPGPVQVRARLAGLDQEALFQATAVGPPELASVVPTEADRGAIVTIDGRNFSPVAAHDLVQFNGVDAEVQTASVDRLTVAVPVFASDGPVTVTLTGVRSNGVPFKVRGPPPVLPAVGSVGLTPLAAGPGGLSGEIRLGFLTGDEQYVLAVEALSTQGGGSFSQSLVGDLADVAGIAAKARPAAPAIRAAVRAQDRLDGLLRGWESRLAELARGLPRPPPARLAVEPQIGDRRDFRAIKTADPNALITDPANFDRVKAVLRYKGAHTLVFVDERVAAVDLTDAEVRQVGERFDTRTYVVDRNAFGSESDIDGDGRVTILLTPTVNGLSRGANPEDGIIVGFFFGLDLVPAVSPTTSNAAELFYGFVPDPSGRFGPAVPREFVVPTLDEVFAHEFQHMISFNEHVLVRSAQSEDLWLNEGLSHVAEDLNGFDTGNRVRSALYLSDPGAAGLALDGRGDALAERGASFLFLRHLGDQRGDGIYKKLVQTPLTGIGNLELATMQAFANLFSDWFAALFLDDSGVASDSRFQIPSLTLRADYERVRTGDPELQLGRFLAVQELVLPGVTASSVTAGTSGAYYVASTAGGPNERKVRVTAPAGSKAQVAVIRTR